MAEIAEFGFVLAGGYAISANGMGIARPRMLTCSQTKLTRTNSRVPWVVSGALTWRRALRWKTNES